jgi:hypothetical protein
MAVENCFCRLLKQLQNQKEHGSKNASTLDKPFVLAADSNVLVQSAS